ncbi:uracil-DNA glycosylase [Novosphingobium huizhouense]|uniref:uracil-DNA glycosylase n=1 Tax=Novosphingobium huizhouense TaxID=2866625 RepID=UPI001CD8A32B|nr:uracil-DNA glycosylase [Novosphingobium huizhouense]
MAAISVPEPWRETLAPLLDATALERISAFLAREERAGKLVYPPPAERLSALALTPPEAVRAVILGQDPYHGAGQAHGLAFSVRHGVKAPPSLVNIHKELAADLALPRPAHGNLEGWARQGVLLLNNALTVEAGRPGSHQKRGWEEITDAIVAAVAKAPAPSVFLLWGSHAQKKGARIAELGGGHHLVLRAPHPSPLSAHAGWFGSRHFSQANAFLESHGRGTIDWRI